ncbi:hypothetical protein KY318_03440, partial [Candidatus Woesearchaeota archaeon]|nr:hypothetical protein [Candidatus Woesearchaeota archaeon]
IVGRAYRLCEDLSSILDSQISAQPDSLEVILKQNPERIAAHCYAREIVMDNPQIHLRVDGKVKASASIKKREYPLEFSLEVPKQDARDFLSRLLDTLDAYRVTEKVVTSSDVLKHKLMSGDLRSKVEYARTESPGTGTRALHVFYVNERLAFVDFANEHMPIELNFDFSWFGKVVGRVAYCSHDSSPSDTACVAIKLKRDMPQSDWLAVAELIDNTLSAAKTVDRVVNQS